MEDLRPEPCQRVMELLIDGQPWRIVTPDEMTVSQALKAVIREAERREDEDGIEHTYGIHSRGIIDASPTEVH